MSTATVPAATAAVRTEDPLGRARRRLVVALLATGLLVPAVLLAVRWPSWWAWIAPEQTPMTWVQSVVLMLSAAGAGLVAVALELRGEGAAARRAWLLIGAGFTALAVDERFAIHERLRDRVLAPRGVEMPFLPWIAPGDFLVLGLGIVGLALLPVVWRAVGTDRASRRALLAGVALAVVAVGLDSVDPSTWSLDAERIQQTGEEIVELASGLCLLAAVALRLLPLLAAPRTGAASDPAAPAG